jgi:hypothetical protein
MTSPPGLGVKGAWLQVVRGEAPPADAAQNVGSRSDAPLVASAAEVQQHSGPKVNSEKSGGGIGGELASVSSKGMEEPAILRIEESSEGEQHPEAESSKGKLGQGSAAPGGGGAAAGDHIVKPAKPACKNASSTLGKTPTTGLVMGAATWPTLGDARHSKTVPSEQPLKIPTPGAPSVNSTSYFSHRHCSLAFTGLKRVHKVQCSATEVENLESLKITLSGGAEKNGVVEVNRLLRRSGMVARVW